MDISIICPIYNGEKYIEDLHKSILVQETNVKFQVRYILTESDDNSEEILKKLSADYTYINKEEFSHSLVREKAIKEVQSEIIVLITQDIKIINDKWLYYLTKDIIEGKCEATFSRQICDDISSIERYTRMKNYPEKSRIASKDNANELGIMAYFYSDASSSIKREIFMELNGYDSKNLITNEDMYIAFKLINNGYRIKYCSESEVIHSHNYSYSSLIKRYFDQGVFLKDHKYISSGANGSAVEMLIFVLKNCISERNLKVAIKIIPNFFIRYLGNKLGQSYKKLSRNWILKLTANKIYWTRIW